MTNLKSTPLNYARHYTCELWPIKAKVVYVSSETEPEVTA